MNRIIKSTSQTKDSQVITALSSLFALELFNPSRELFLYSPWITDVILINNHHGQFRAILPEFEYQRISLSSILNTLSNRGTKIHLLMRPELSSYTKEFFGRLSNEIQFKLIPNLHEKILLTETFFFRGSMNFTYSGIYLNDEHTEITTDPQLIAQAITEAKHRWRESIR